MRSAWVGLRSVADGSGLRRARRAQAAPSSTSCRLMLMMVSSPDGGGAIQAGQLDPAGNRAVRLIRPVFPAAAGLAGWDRIGTVRQGEVGGLDQRGSLADLLQQ